MREIKFRGLDSMTGEWVYGNLVILGTGSNYIIPQNVISNDIPQWLVDRDTVGQYTGLKDKNGKKIYGGDILGIDMGVTGIVKYDNGGTSFYLDVIEYKDVFRVEDGEQVIGNIYENPELLKSGETNA